ncbi:MAG TPA: site-specific integrase [Bacteroidota bacterium]|nr:site-specific integrase [Bacteroidota bacterium]
MPSLIKDKRGTFYAVYSVNGKRVWRPLKTKDRRTAQKLFLDQSDGPASTDRLTLDRAIPDYLTFVKANLAEKTHSLYFQCLKRLSTFLARNKPIAEITNRDLELYKIHRKETVSAWTVNQDLRAFRAFFNKLKEWGLIPETPCRGIKDIRIADTIRPYLSEEALSSLLEKTKGSQLHNIILFAAMTGLRRGELINLKWEDIDLNRGSILVRSSISYRTKAGKIRTIPANSMVLELLKGLPHRSGHIFQARDGGPLYGNFLRHKFKEAVRSCGLDSALHFHSLRHTFASLLVQKGVSLYHVQKLLGHSSPRVTEIYAHLAVPELATTVERLVSGSHM